MEQTKEFIDYLKEPPKKIVTRRHAKHAGFESQFDNPYYLITWALEGKKEVTIRIDGPDYYDQKRHRAIDNYSLKGLQFKSYVFYGLIPRKKVMLINSLTPDIKEFLLKRGKGLVKDGDIGFADLKKYI